MAKKPPSKKNPETPPTEDASFTPVLSESRDVGPADKPKVGRPTKYTKELGEEICRLMVEEDGYKGTLRGICAREDMPCRWTVCRWLADHKDFSDLYSRARDAAVEIELSDIVSIADDGSADWETRTDARGNTYEVENKEVTRRSELRVNARLKRAAMLAPRKYGTLTKHEMTGKDGGAIVVMSGADERI
jgi:hypothetical protein